MPVFTIRKQNADGSISDRKYRVIGNVVRQVLAPGEQPQTGRALAGRPKKKESPGKKAAHSSPPHARRGNAELPELPGWTLNLNFCSGLSIPAGPK